MDKQAITDKAIIQILNKTTYFFSTLKELESSFYFVLSYFLIVNK